MGYKIMKKAKKDITNLVGTSLITSGGSMALGAIGGTTATYGQQGLGNVMRFAPVMGTMAGVGMLTRSLGSLEKATKRKRKRR